MEIKNKRILVTGCTGFIGKYLIKVLSEHNKIFCLGRRVDNSIQESNITHINHDLKDKFRADLLPRDLNHIIHLAAITIRNLDKIDMLISDYYRVNTTSTLELLEYGKKVGIDSFIYASTGGVYGYSKDKLTEDSPVSPNDFHDITKYNSEMLVNYYSQYFSTTILRYFFPYGPGQTNRLIPSLINKIKAGEPITIYNDGRNPKINPIYISDAVELTKRSILLSGENTVNIAGTEVVSILELSKLIGLLIGKNVKFKYAVEKRITDMIGDITKSLSLLGYTPTISLEKGLKRTIGWYK